MGKNRPPTWRELDQWAYVDDLMRSADEHLHRARALTREAIHLVDVLTEEDN